MTLQSDHDEDVRNLTRLQAQYEPDSWEWKMLEEAKRWWMIPLPPLKPAIVFKCEDD